MAPADPSSIAQLIRESAAVAAKAVIDELRRHPLVAAEFLSMQDAACYLGYSEQQLCEFVRQGWAPKSISFSSAARRFKRSDLDAWAAAGGPKPYREGHHDA